MISFQSVFWLIFFSSWLIISIVNQLDGMVLRKVKYWDFFALIPSWKFFAPIPGIYDYYFLYRDKYSDNSLGFWKEFSLYENSNYWLRPFWNPEKRITKIIYDLVKALYSLSKYYKGHEIMITAPYLCLLQFALEQPKSKLTVSRQFMIISVQGFSLTEKTYRIPFISNFHKWK